MATQGTSVQPCEYVSLKPQVEEALLHLNQEWIDEVESWIGERGSETSACSFAGWVAAMPHCLFWLSEEELEVLQ